MIKFECESVEEFRALLEMLRDIATTPPPQELTDKLKHSTDELEAAVNTVKEK